MDASSEAPREDADSDPRPNATRKRTAEIAIQAYWAGDAASPEREIAPASVARAIEDLPPNSSRFSAESYMNGLKRGYYHCAAYRVTHVINGSKARVGRDEVVALDLFVAGREEDIFTFYRITLTSTGAEIAFNVPDKGQVVPEEEDMSESVNAGLVLYLNAGANTTMSESLLAQADITAAP